MNGNKNNIQELQEKSSFASVGQMLKECRRKINCSQKDIADRLGYFNFNFMSMIEKGRTGIPANRFMDFMNAYEVPPESRFALYKTCYPQHWEVVEQLMAA